ncbi:MAG: tetratricopeptide repeat protein [Candidatus Neomarinimicrobiota bacterium]|nr:MAG: tetratricopeptide repeat protein [Candidatus Neomarinimicrobiota bacterium]
MKKFGSLVLLLLLSLVSGQGTARVAYTRPGTMMKIPVSYATRTPYLFRTGFGAEVHNFNPLNVAKGVYFDMELGKSFLFGFSSVMGADTTSLANLGNVQTNIPVEFGFHLQQRIYTYGDISVSIGLQDIVFQNDPQKGLTLDPQQLSFFAVIASEKSLGTYTMNTYMGFGTGSLAPQDTLPAADTAATNKTKAGVFAGFILNTPYLSKAGGLDLVGEFDGTGINVGLRIPLTSDYRLNLGFTHIEKLPDWKSRYWTGHPGVTLGLDMAVPLAVKKAPAPTGGPAPPVEGGETIELPGLEEGISSSVDSTLRMADLQVHTLRDSMQLMDNEMRNLMIRLAAQEQRAKFLEDSLRSIKLDRNVLVKNMNEAMRNLSRSLRYFYTGDYRRALEEVEKAIELNPNLALAYARRGSIYYKLGDIQRATIDWNLALRLDPEYEDVRNILKALHENRLKSTSLLEE